MNVYLKGDKPVFHKKNMAWFFIVIVLVFISTLMFFYVESHNEKVKNTFEKIETTTLTINSKCIDGKLMIEYNGKWLYPYSNYKGHRLSCE